jgi:hypothetical protein
MYFSHAFKKSWLGKDASGNLSFLGSGATVIKTNSLTAGQIGMFSATTGLLLTTGTAAPFILAQGSYYTNDKISPALGGYQESVKSKVINPKYVSRVFKTAYYAPASQVISIGWDTITPTTLTQHFQFECGKTYRLRLDIKGSPALRFLDHNVYRVVDAFSGCCTDDCSAVCTGAIVDGASVLLKWKDQLLRTPLTSTFVQPQVLIRNASNIAEEVFSDEDVIAGRNATSFTGNIASSTTLTVTANTGNPIAIGMTISSATAGIAAAATITAQLTSTEPNGILGGKGTYTMSATATATTTGLTIAGTKAAYVPAASGTLGSAVVAGLKLSMAYIDTKFGTCTFTPMDFYELAPLLAFASIQDETGNPCAIKPYANTSTGDFVKELVTPRQIQGTGETVVRDLILSGRYRQEAFPDSMNVNHLRMREIEGNPSVTNFDKTQTFNTLNILHNVPRFNNPTSTFDNDQYLLTIYIPSGTQASALTTWVSAMLTAAGNGVTIEDFKQDFVGTANITTGSTTISVTAVTSGSIVIGQTITVGAGVANAIVVAFGTGTGGVGTYQISNAATATTTGLTINASNASSTI